MMVTTLRLVSQVQEKVMEVIFTQISNNLLIGENEPMLYVDVNLGNSGTQRIVVFEGDTAEGLAEKFSQEHDIDETMKNKLILMLQQQIAGVLEKIDEE